MFGLKPEGLTLFTPFFRYVDNRLLFNYGNTEVESWAPGLHRVPASLEFWQADAGHPNLVTDLYISHSAAELLCFASLRSYNLMRFPEQLAFAALGLCPSEIQVNILKTAYPLARWHLLFGSDLVGRITDAAVASWYKKRSVSFSLYNEELIIKYCGKLYAIESRIFSLNRFEHHTGLRTGMRTHKPPRGLPSFIDLQFPNHDP